MEDYKIIENTWKEKENYGLSYGFEDINLTAEQIGALLGGKVVACNNSEYTFFITFDRG